MRIAKEFYAGYLDNKGYESGQKYDYTNALEYLGRSVKIQEEIGDKKELIASLSSIGAIYEKQKEYDQALKNYSHAIKVQQITGDTKYLVVLYNNIGVIFDKTDKADSALIYYLKALKIVDETKGKSIEIPALYASIGTNMLKRSELEKALFYCTLSDQSGLEN